MNIGLTQIHIKGEATRLLWLMVGGENPYEALKVRLTAHDYDHELTISFGSQSAVAILPPEALMLSLDSFSKMYLFPLVKALLP